jgi:hypothetical protein
MAMEQEEKEYHASLQHRTSIRLGDLAYLLVFTDLNQEQQEAELQRALRKFGSGQSGPIQPVMLLSPTPSNSMIGNHGYRILDAHFHGTTSTVSMGYDQCSGNPVIVKMVKCRNSQFGDLRDEIEILRRLNHVKPSLQLAECD